MLTAALVGLLVIGLLPAGAASAVDVSEVCEGAPQTFFVDGTSISAGQQANVQCMAAYGITGGFADGTFRPGAPVDRQQMASFIARMIAQAQVGDHREVPSDAPMVFADVDPNNVHAAAINWLASIGVTSGVAPGVYDPSGVVTRQQMASFIARAHQYLGAYSEQDLPGIVAGSTQPPFPDINEASGAHRLNIQVLQALGIVQGLADGRYAPGNEVTRQQMAAFIVRSAAELEDRGLWSGRFIDPETGEPIPTDLPIEVALSVEPAAPTVNETATVSVTLSAADSSVDLEGLLVQFGVFAQATSIDDVVDDQGLIGARLRSGEDEANAQGRASFSTEPGLPAGELLVVAWVAEERTFDTNEALGIGSARLEVREAGVPAYQVDLQVETAQLDTVSTATFRTTLASDGEESVEGTLMQFAVFYDQTTRDEVIDANGSLSGADLQQDATVDADGVATFEIGPDLPAGEHLAVAWASAQPTTSTSEALAIDDLAFSVTAPPQPWERNNETFTTAPELLRVERGEDGVVTWFFSKEIVGVAVGAARADGFRLYDPNGSYITPDRNRVNIVDGTTVEARFNTTDGQVGERYGRAIRAGVRAGVVQDRTAFLNLAGDYPLVGRAATVTQLSPELLRVENLQTEAFLQSGTDVPLDFVDFVFSDPDGVLSAIGAEVMTPWFRLYGRQGQVWFPGPLTGEGTANAFFATDDGGFVRVRVPFGPPGNVDSIAAGQLRRGSFSLLGWPPGTSPLVENEEEQEVQDRVRPFGNNDDILLRGEFDEGLTQYDLLRLFSDVCNFLTACGQSLIDLSALAPIIWTAGYEDREDESSGPSLIAVERDDQQDGYRFVFDRPVSRDDAAERQFYLVIRFVDVDITVEGDPPSITAVESVVSTQVLRNNRRIVSTTDNAVVASFDSIPEGAEVVAGFLPGNAVRASDEESLGTNFGYNRPGYRRVDLPEVEERTPGITDNFDLVSAEVILDRISGGHVDFTFDRATVEGFGLNSELFEGVTMRDAAEFKLYDERGTVAIIDGPGRLIGGTTLRFETDNELVRGLDDLESTVAVTVQPLSLTIDRGSGPHLDVFFTEGRVGVGEIQTR